MSESILIGEGSEQIKILQTIKRQRFLRLLKGLLFLSPSIILFSVFLFYPLGRTFYLSFFLTNNLGEPTVFVGFENFLNLLSSENFAKSITATFTFVLYTVPGTVFTSLVLAILANEKLKGVGIFRTLYSSTMGISTAAASVFWLFLFHPTIGWLNQILQLIGLDSVGWLTDPDWALFSVSVATIWMNVGFTFLILLGGLQSIDRHLYESAEIDGAGYFYQLRRITIPMLSPSLFFVVTVTFINAFQTFGQIDMLTRGGPQNETNLIVYSIYQDAFMNYQFGTASAQAIVLFIIILILTLIQFKLGERKVHYQ